MRPTSPQEGIVDAEVGAPGGLRAARRDPPGGHVHGRVVGRPAALYDPQRGTAGGLEAGRLGRAGYGAQRLPPLGGVHAANPLDEGGGHVAPDHGLAEGTGPRHESRHERERVSHGGAVAERPGEHRDPPPAVRQDLDRVRPDADEQLAGVPCRARQVAAPVDRHHAALVRAAPRPAHGVERRRGQREHRGEVLRERLRRGPAVSRPRGCVQAVAPVAQHRVQLGEGADPGHRHEQVPPQEPHGVLHGALLVARAGVAVAAPHAVVGAEQREQVRLGDLPANPAAGLGGVVEDELAGRAPDPPEDASQPRAHALRALGHAGDGVARVRVGQRDHEQLQAQPLARDHRPEVAVVPLRGAGRPLELEVAVPRARRPREPPLAHVAPHGGVGALVAPLLDEPVVDPLGGVALLARGAQVGLEHPVDPGGVRVDRRVRPVCGRGRLRRQVLHVGVLGDGVAAEAEPAGYLGPRHPLRVHRAYIIPHIQGHGHLLHPSRAALAKVHARENHTAGAAPPVPGGAALMLKLLSY